MAQGATFLTKFTADDRGLRGALKNARSGLTGLGGSLRNVNSIAGGIMIASAIRGGIRAIRNLTTETMNAVKIMQQFETQFTLIEGGSKKAGKEVMDFLKGMSLETAQSVEELGNLYAGMRAFTSTSQQAKDMVETMADLSAVFPALNSNMSKASYNIGQLARGIGTAIDIREFARSGLQISEVWLHLSDSTGVAISSLADYNKALKAGRLTSDDFYEAMFAYGDQFENAAEKMVKTWKGLNQVLKNTRDVVVSDLVGPTLNIMAEFGANSLARFQANFVNKGKIKQMGEDFAGALRGAMQLIGKPLPLPEMRIAGGDVRPDPKVLESPAYLSVINLKETIDTYGPPIIEYFQTLGTVLLGMKAAALVIAILTNPMVLLGALLLGGIALLVMWKHNLFGIQEVTGTLASGALTLLNNGLDTLRGFITGIVERFQAWVDGGSTLANTLKNIIEFVQNMAIAYGGVLGPILKTVTGIIKRFVIPALVLIGKWVWTLLKFVGSLVNVGIQALIVVFRILAGIASNVIMPIFRILWSFLKAKLAPAIRVVKGLFVIWQVVITKVTGFVQGLIDSIMGLANKLSALKLPDWLTPGSPTPFELGLRGINKEITRADRLFARSNFTAGGLTTGINQNSIQVVVYAEGDPNAIADAVAKTLGDKLRGQGMSNN